MRRRVSPNLSVGLTRHNDTAVLTLTNHLAAPLVVNPPSWLGRVLGPEEAPTALAPAPLRLCLGYIQLFGYVVCNYRFDFNDGNIDIGGDVPFSVRDHAGGDSGPTNDDAYAALPLWSNRDYIHTYNSDRLDETAPHEGWDDVDGGTGVDEILATTAYIAQSLRHRMVVGGKVGGIPDLVSAPPGAAAPPVAMDRYRRYVLQDLVGDPLPEPRAAAAAGATDAAEIIRALSDAILPFYTTLQRLLFLDLTIPAGHTHTVRLRLDAPPASMPPSYNTRLTALAGDQGMCSIRYALAVGVLEMGPRGLEARTAYFPYHVERGGHPQVDYLQRVVIDQRWCAEATDGARGSAGTNGADTAATADASAAAASAAASASGTLDRPAFIEDLHKLIASSLHDVPSIAQRRRSSAAEFELPHHKTQYQIRLNAEQLCMISVFKPFFRPGDDVNFVIDTAEQPPLARARVAGVVAHLEAHERFHCRRGQQPRDFVHVYKVSPSVKVSIFGAASLAAPTARVVHGAVNVAAHLTPQWRSSRLMDLEYFLAFKFTLAEFAHDHAGSEFRFKLPVMVV